MRIGSFVLFLFLATSCNIKTSLETELFPVKGFNEPEQPNGMNGPAAPRY